MKNLCKEKNNLLNTYEECARTYSTAVSDLRQKMGVLSQPEFQALYDQTEELRLKAREAQEALQRHIAHHRC